LKQALLFVVLLFAAASAPCQTNPGLVPGDPDVQQPQGGDAPVYLQLHDIPPQLRTSELLRQLHMLQEPQSADSALSSFQQLSAAAPTVIDSHVA
jgi:hypothetical protein